MKKFIFAIGCYLAGLTSLGAFFWIIEFGSGPESAFSWKLLLLDLLLFMIFPLQHSLLARPVWKGWMHRHFDPSMERPFYVGTSGFAMWLIVYFWHPFGPMLYQVQPGIIFDVIFYAALLLIIFSTLALDHAAMFGLKQGYFAWKGKEFEESAGLQTKGIYGIVRHPITSLLIVALWSHPRLTGGGLLFNMLFSSYALIGTLFEERDLLKVFGEEYRTYSRQVPAFIPRLG